MMMLNMGMVVMMAASGKMYVMTLVNTWMWGLCVSTARSSEPSSPATGSVRCALERAAALVCPRLESTR